MYNYILYLIISILFIILFFLLYSNFYQISHYSNFFQISHQKVCDDIHNQKSLYTKQKILRGFLSNEECDSIIKEGENYSSIHGWTTKRHDNYPTTDNKINTNWKCYSNIEKKIKQILYPEFSNLFNINKTLLEIEELFIAKYDGNLNNAQKSLDFHEDDSEFSFIIALNDNYEGGGTYFVKNKKIVNLNKGDVVIFCGQTRHGGLPVTEGVRYILPGFIYYGKCEQLDDDDDDE